MRGLAEHGLRTALGSVGGEPPKGTAARTREVLAPREGAQRQRLDASDSL
jgi:hypothetical protein